MAPTIALSPMCNQMTEMFKGTLEGIVPAIMTVRPAYSYEITAELREQGFTDIVEGTVYTLLIRVVQRGFVNVEKVPSEKGLPRKVGLSREGHVDRATLGNFRRHLVGDVEGGQVVPQSSASAEDNRGDHQVQVIDKAGAQEVAPRAGPTADAHVQAAGSRGRFR